MASSVFSFASGRISSAIFFLPRRKARTSQTVPTIAGKIGSSVPSRQLSAAQSSVMRAAFSQ